MKRFFSAVGLCVFLLLFGLFVFLPASQAENNTLLNLLNLPAPPPPNPLVKNNFGRRAENFFSKDNPPKDDAPIEDLMDYWKAQSVSYRELGYNIKPSEKSLRRILAELEKEPEKLPQFLNILPEGAETAAFVKGFYDQEMSGRNFEDGWRGQVRRWLTYHSNYFSDELLKDARRVQDVNEYVSNQAELLALARVDWDKARPILDRLLNDASQPVSQTLALWAFYRHAMDADDSSDIEKYRGELKKVVEDKNATAGMRDLAFDALVKEKDWQGRDEWYFTLLEDETLLDLKVNGSTYTGLTTILIYSSPDKYVAKMLELLKSDNQAVRNAVVRNLDRLLSERNPEVVKALLPWLENPKWAKEIGGERRNIINALVSVQLPESVPGLIAVLNEKDVRETMDSPNSNSNSIYMGNVGGTRRQVDYYPYRYAAIQALAMQKDARAVPALRMVLPQVEEYERRMVVRALFLSGGFSTSEQVEALEFIAKNLNQRNDAMQTSANTTNSVAMEVVRETMTVANIAVANVRNYASVQTAPTDIRMILGMHLLEPMEPGDELVAAVLDRIELLDKKEPNVAVVMRNIIQNWRGAAVNLMLLKDLKNNRTDVNGIVKLLSLRKELKEKQFNEVYDIRGGGSLALGISACLIEAAADYDAILASENVESKIAMLGCARLIRAPLSVREVAKNLQSPNKMLALAAERYLESEDSPEARRIVLALYPNEARVLGARNAFSSGADSAVNNNFLRELFISVDESYAVLPPSYFDISFEALTANEKKLRKEVVENQELLGIYSYDNNFIRIYKEKAVFSWDEDQSRYRERILSKEEFDAFKSYLASHGVDELPPFLYGCEGACYTKELLMLGRSGGRRVFHLGSKVPKFFGELQKMFDELRKPPARLHYWLEKNIDGLEILFEDENLQALAVWKNGDDFRVLIADEARRRQIDAELLRQEQDAEESVEENEENYDKEQATLWEKRRRRQYENYAWYKFAPESKLSGLADQPAGVEFIPVRDNLPVAADDRQWKARAANFEIRAGDEGLYKIVRGQAAKIREGYYVKPLLTPNGRWAIATRYGEEEPPRLVRVNLLTGKEFKIQLEEYPMYEAVAFIPSINKVLVFGGTSNGDEEYLDTKIRETRYGDYFLLDAETGSAQATKGETRPLAQQTFRPLQPTAKPDEFWAAIPDREKNETLFGVYNTKTLAFKSLIKLPEIVFDSMDMWVDERESKIYFVYEGQLLRLPLPKNN